MSRLIRLDRTGHTELATWTADDRASHEAAVEAFRRELDEFVESLATRIERIKRYVEQYDGGDCFFVLPVALLRGRASREKPLQVNSAISLARPVRRPAMVG